MIMLFVGKNGCPCTMAHGKHELFLKFFSGKLPALGVLVKVARQGCSERAAYSASTLSYSLRACSSRLLDKAAMPGLRALHQLQTACFCLAHQARPTKLLGKACAQCINSKPPVSGTSDCTRATPSLAPPANGSHARANTSTSGGGGACRLADPSACTSTPTIAGVVWLYERRNMPARTLVHTPAQARAQLLPGSSCIPCLCACPRHILATMTGLQSL